MPPSAQVTNIPSKLLEPDENKLVVSLLGAKCTSLATTVAQLFYADNNRWTIQSTGVLCFVRDANARSFFLRFYDLDQCKMLFEQEIYRGMQYKSQYPFFHQVEADERVVGFNFTEDNEGQDEAHFLATTLKGKVDKMAENVAPQQVLVQPPLYSIQTQSSNMMGSQDRRSSISQLTPATQKAKKPTKGPGGKSKQPASVKPKIRREDIGKPTELRHVQHVGYDNLEGGAMQQIDIASDPVLKFLFGQIGQDFDATVSTKKGQKGVQNFITAQGGMDKIREMAKQSGFSAPAPSVPPSPGPQLSAPVQSSDGRRALPLRPTRPPGPPPPAPTPASAPPAPASTPTAPPAPPASPAPPAPSTQSPAPATARALPPPPAPSTAPPLPSSAPPLPPKFPLSQPPVKEPQQQSGGPPPSPARQHPLPPPSHPPTTMESKVTPNASDVTSKPKDTPVAVSGRSFLSDIRDFNTDRLRRVQESRPTGQPSHSTGTAGGGSGNLLDALKKALDDVREAAQGDSDSEDEDGDSDDDEKWIA